MSKGPSTNDMDPPVMPASTADAAHRLDARSGNRSPLGSDDVVEALKCLYDKTLSEPIPARFLELLEQIDKATETAVTDLSVVTPPPNCEPLAST